MRKVALAVSTALIASGCAAPAYQAQPYRPAYSEDRNQLASQSMELKKKRDTLRDMLAATKLQADIDDLKRKIDDLEKQIDSLEQRIADMDRAANAIPSPGRSSGGQQYIGPRGGCYTITKSGKKNYGGCK